MCLARGSGQTSHLHMPIFMISGDQEPPAALRVCPGLCRDCFMFLPATRLDDCSGSP